MKKIIILMLFLISCGDYQFGYSDEMRNKNFTSPILMDAGSSIKAPECGGNTCYLPPYSQLNGQISTWADSSCSGDWARGALSENKYPCAQWQNGDVYCVSLNEPVPHIYFKDPNDNFACKEWMITQEAWFKWRFCGNQPIGE